MASKKKDDEVGNVPGMKKREKNAAGADGPSVEESTEGQDITSSPAPEAAAPKVDEDGVVRAPEAPTTAPTRVAPQEGGPRRRVVDPRAEALAEKEREAKAKLEKDKQEQARKSANAASQKKDSSPSKGARAQEARDKEAMANFGMSFDGGTTDDFAALFEGSGGLSKRRYFDMGDTVEGTVVTVGERYIFVDLGDGHEGIADRAQYLNDEGQVELVAGQTLEFFVIGLKGGIQLGKEIGGDQAGLDAIEAAHSSGVPVSGKVTGTNKGGFEVSINGIQAFCPISQIELGFTEDPEIHVGQTYTFEVSEVREGGRTIVVSRTALLERQQAEIRAKTMESLEVGSRIDGVVTRVAEFGAFVDLGGIEGLVHVSEMSHIYFDKPSEIVKEGDQVQVEVLSIEEDPKKGLRIGLSMKAVEDDPWLKVNQEFAIGGKTTGTVVRVASFGAFVEIMPGVEGLVHVSEMSWKKHVATASDVVSVGDQIDVEIQDIDLMRRRISLSMKAIEGDPWREVAADYPIGTEVTGKVANVEDFGAFIDLGTGITALLPRSEMNLSSETTAHRKYSSGQEVTARVLNVEPDRRRMALTLKEASELDVDTSAAKSAPAGNDKELRAYKDEDISSKGTFGTLGDLLKARKKK